MGKVNNKKSSAEMIQCNRMVVVSHFVEIMILIAAYILEMIKGERELPYVIVMALIGLAAPVLEFIVYRRKPMSRAIMYLFSVGFGIFYIYILFTSTSNLTFVYVVPMLIVIAVYNEALYALKVNIFAFVINIAQVILYFSNGTYTIENDLKDVEIQLCLVLVMAIFSIYVSKVTEKNYKYNFDKIEQQKEQSETLLSDTLKISNEMVDTIEVVSEKIKNLDRTISATKDAMAELNSGSNETTDAVEKQLGLTENIQTKVEGVQDGTGKIVTSVKNTNEAIKVGRDNIDKLVEKGNESMESGRLVESELKTLYANMEELNYVVEIINNVTSQTELLSFNASIEAARAGESGRGFAVVASEISKMAAETGVATGQITGILSKITETIENVVTVTNAMVDMIESQNEATMVTAESFKKIADNTNDISNHSDTLERYVEELAEANSQIAESISTISSITEEVTAHASETYNVSENNIDIVKGVVESIDELKELAIRLK